MEGTELAGLFRSNTSGGSISLNAVIFANKGPKGLAGTDCAGARGSLASPRPYCVYPHGWCARPVRLSRGTQSLLRKASLTESASKRAASYGHFSAGGLPKTVAGERLKGTTERFSGVGPTPPKRPYPPPARPRRRRPGRRVLGLPSGSNRKAEVR